MLELISGSAPPSVTALLLRWRSGDRDALQSLAPLVYDQLRKLARSQLRRERPGHTLQTTALVHEAYLRLVCGAVPAWQNRAHFFGIAASAMRQVLVERARLRKTAKRGGSVCRLTLSEVAEPAAPAGVDVVALDDALNGLSKLDPQQARIVEMRFFAGLSIEETAEALGISISTVKRDWNTARVWLFRELRRVAAS